MQDFIAPGWENTFCRQGLDFDRLWQLELEPLDTPNTGRGRNGWSRVSFLTLQPAEGLQKRVVLKRQQNHFSRTFRHPLRGVPTFEKEFLNCWRYKRAGIPAIEPLYYARRSREGAVQAILITEFLEGYMALDDLTRKWQAQGWPGVRERAGLIEAIAQVVSALHSRRLKHNQLHGKHVLIRDSGGRFQVRLVDLEKTKWHPLGNQHRVRDLESLHRRTALWSLADRVRFLKAYCGVADIRDPGARRLCRQIVRRHQEKIRRAS